MLRQGPPRRSPSPQPRRSSAAFALVFFYAPLTPTRASSRRSSTCTCRWRSWRCAASSLGGICAIRYLRTGDRKWDLRSYVAIHLSLILGVGVLITGSIWAKASWGHWWVWDEPTLVSFLIVFLLYACLPAAALLDRGPGAARRATRRCSRSPPARSCRSTSSPCAWPSRWPTRACSARRREPARLDAADVPGLAARDGAAVRHALEVRADRQGRARRSCARCGASSPATMTSTIAQACAAVMIAARCRCPRSRCTRPASTSPAPTWSFVTMILIYVAIMAMRLARIERELAELDELGRRRRDEDARAERGA